MLIPTLTITTAALGASYFAPHALRIAGPRRLRRACTAQRALVLTYDDGPGPELTPQLLDMLERGRVTATFFPSGERATSAPALMHRLADAGHEVGCHGCRHVHAWRSWPWTAAADVSAGYRALADTVPGNATFRPPHGKLTAVTWATVRARGASLGWWTVDSGDTWPRTPSPDRIVRRIRRAGGGVVLMHDRDRESERGQFVLDTTDALLKTAGRTGWKVLRLRDLHAGMRTRAPAGT